MPSLIWILCYSSCVLSIYFSSLGWMKVVVCGFIIFVVCVGCERYGEETQFLLATCSLLHSHHCLGLITPVGFGLAIKAEPEDTGGTGEIPLSQNCWVWRSDLFLPCRGGKALSLVHCTSPAARTIRSGQVPLAAQSAWGPSIGTQRADFAGSQCHSLVFKGMQGAANTAEGLDLLNSLIYDWLSSPLVF